MLERQPHTQPADRSRAILRLRPALGGLGHDAGRVMHEHDGRLDLVAMLPSRAAATGARLGPVMAVRKVRVRSGASRFDFVVPQAPSRAGIDPYNLLIDRNPGDNTKEIR